MTDHHSDRQRGPRLVLILCLGALFLILAGGVALLSGNVYRATVAAGDENFAHRTALSYIVNQVRRGDAADAVAVGSFRGVRAIRLTEHLDVGDYETFLYCMDGQLMELYTESGSGLGPEDGMSIMELADLRVTLADGLLTISVVDSQGNPWQVTLAPRCGVKEVGEL